MRLDRDLASNIVGTTAVLWEAALGAEATSAWMTTLGLLMGARVEEWYKRGWGIRRSLSTEKYGHIIVDVYNSIGGDSFLTGANLEKVAIGCLRCPFGDLIHSAPNLCRLTGSLFGDIGARNFGYAKVIHRRRIAARDESCEIVIHLGNTLESQAERGEEYRSTASPLGAGSTAPPSRAQRIASAGQELREKLLGLGVTVDRWSLLARASGLFRPAATVEEVVQETAALASEGLGGAWAIYLLSPENPDRMEVSAVYHRIPSVAQAVRELLAQNPWVARDLIARSRRDGQPILISSSPGCPMLPSPEERHALDLAGLDSLLVVPLTVESRPLGALLCGSGPDRRLDESDLHVAARFAELAAAAIDTARRERELRETLQARDTFTSAASHELLSSLTQVKALAQISARALHKEDPDGIARVEHNLEAMIRHVDGLAELIRDVADASLITTARMELQRAPTSLNAVVTGVAERFQRIAGEQSKYRMKIELPKEQLMGMWDRNRIDQLLTNLLAGAVARSPHGGLLMVRVERGEQPELEASGQTGREGTAASRSPTALVTILDEGISIPAQEQASLFAPFSRGGIASQARWEGSGLALHICKGIVEAHRGRMWFESRPERGSAFYFTLPLRE